MNLRLQPALMFSHEREQIRRGCRYRNWRPGPPGLRFFDRIALGNVRGSSRGAKKERVVPLGMFGRRVRNRRRRFITRSGLCPKKVSGTFVLWLARPHHTIGRVPDTFFGQSPRSVMTTLGEPRWRASSFVTQNPTIVFIRPRCMTRTIPSTGLTPTNSRPRHRYRSSLLPVRYL